MTHHIPHRFYGPDPTHDPSHVAIILRLADSTDDVLVRHVRLLRNCVALAQKRWAFTIDAAVVLPSEMQLLCAFQDTEFGVGRAVNMIRASFTRHLPGLVRGVWDNHPEVSEIPDECIAMHRNFVEAAPVRAGLAKSACDWPYSSAHVGTAQGGDLGVAVA